MKFFYYYIYFIGYLIICGVAKAEFYFSKAESPEQNPSYLFKEFPNVTESRFPAKLEISFSLSSFKEMLYASLDQFVNSLLLEKFNNGIRIYYNLERKEIQLDIFCNCKRKCLDEQVTIEVVIKDKVIFRCNNGQQHELKLDKSNDRRLVKPYILFPKTNVTNQAILYIVNHRQYPFHRPYSNQLVGCIFEVKYNDKVIKMEKEGPDVEEGCPRRCNGRGSTDLCNDGLCIETFSKYNVLCDCTKSIFNGPRCNEGHPTQFVNTSLKLQDKYLKISLGSNGNATFEINEKKNSGDQPLMKMTNSRSRLTIKYQLTDIDGFQDNREIKLPYNSNNTNYSILLNLVDGDIKLEIPQKFQTLYIKKEYLKPNNDLEIKFYGHMALGYQSKSSSNWLNYNISILNKLETLTKSTIKPMKSNGSLIFGQVRNKHLNNEGSFKIATIILAICVALLVITVIICYVNRKALLEKKRRFKRCIKSQRTKNPTNNTYVNETDTENNTFEEIAPQTDNEEEEEILVENAFHSKDEIVVAEIATQYKDEIVMAEIATQFKDEIVMAEIATQSKDEKILVEIATQSNEENANTDIAIQTDIENRTLIEIATQTEEEQNLTTETSCANKEEQNLPEEETCPETKEQNVTTEETCPENKEQNVTTEETCPENEKKQNLIVEESSTQNNEILDGNSSQISNYFDGIVSESIEEITVAENNTSESNTDIKTPNIASDDNKRSPAEIDAESKGNKVPIGVGDEIDDLYNENNETSPAEVGIEFDGNKDATCNINRVKIEIKEYFYEKDSDTKFISTNLPIRAKDLKNKMNNIPSEIILISEDKEVKDEYNINEEINNLKYILVNEFQSYDEMKPFHCTAERQIFTYEKEDKCLFIKQYLDVPVENILQEVKILKKLQNHDNIVKVKSLQKLKSNLVLVIEYHTKGTLKEHLMKKEISEREELLVNTYLGQLLDVVRYIHSQGFVHGDFVCDNILISNDTKLVKLVGFDNAEYLRTQENEVCTKNVIHFRDSNITNERHDIRCLGVCIKEMIGESNSYVPKNEFLKSVITDCIQEDKQAIPSASELIERFNKIINT